MTKPIAFALDMLPLDGESHSKWQSNPTESRALGHVERVCEDYLNKCFDYFVSPPAKSVSPPAKCVSPPAKRLVEPERPVTPLERVDPSVLMTGAHVEVTSRLPTPPLMTRCNKSTQAYSSHLELGKRLLEQPPFLPNKKLAIQPKPLLNQSIPLFCLCPNIILC
ncbi:hypothetical protein TNCT_514291 [Trichonephila clavata]|uniref:Uncharacterized protein n=2 Tax=Trichonephila clavata TaxID=2740835 RepID=A0A8X6F853_TRICU|nr:hypothetical protein TNCT_514291 [Trichonephila clavata]